MPPRASRRSTGHASPRWRCQVAVVGSGAEWEAAAEEVGRLLAERGCTVVTGGLDEVMAAAHRGAKAAGGTTIAILPGEEPGGGEPVGRSCRRDRDRPRAQPRGRRVGRRGDRGRRKLRHDRGDGARATARKAASSRSPARRRSRGHSCALRRRSRPSTSRYETSARRRSRYRVSASFVVSSSARRYAAAASSRRSSRR